MATFYANVGDTSITHDEFVGDGIQFNLTGEKQTIVPQEKDVDTSSSGYDSSTIMDYNLLKKITTMMKNFAFESKGSKDHSTSSDELSNVEDDTSDDETEDVISTKYAET